MNIVLLDTVLPVSMFITSEMPLKKFLSVSLTQDNALVGDDFMNQIEPVAAYLPYMTCPGNHEQA